MTEDLDVAVLVGSLRKGSHTRKVANALIGLAPQGMTGRLVEIGELAMYNEDFDPDPPASWVRFRQEVARADGILLCTPEYNRSVPACLKNALDVGSRPYGKSVWNGKPVGVVSVTPHKLGAFGANHIVRQSLVFLNMPVMQQPEAYVSGAAELFDEQGRLKADETRRFLGNFMSSFRDWVARFAAAAMPEQRRRTA